MDDAIALLPDDIGLRLRGLHRQTPKEFHERCTQLADAIYQTVPYQHLHSTARGYMPYADVAMCSAGIPYGFL